MQNKPSPEEIKKILAEVSILKNERLTKLMNSTAESCMSDLFQEQKDTFGIDWEKAVANGKDGMQDAFFQVKNILIRISEDLSESERYKATELGLLTKDGEISVLRHGVFPALYSGTSGADVIRFVQCSPAGARDGV